MVDCWDRVRGCPVRLGGWLRESSQWLTGQDYPHLCPRLYRVYFLSIFCPGQRRQAQWAGYKAGVGWVEGMHHQPFAMLLTPAFLLWR